MSLPLLCDEHIPSSVIKGLRRRGVDVVSIQDLDLFSEEDEKIIDKAHEQERIIYTRDDDFLKIHSRGYSHRGIIYHHPLSYSIGEAIQKLEIFCQIVSCEEMKGKIKFL
jgi:uncharacterized protein with PIN domain